MPLAPQISELGELSERQLISRVSRLPEMGAFTPAYAKWSPKPNDRRGWLRCAIQYLEWDYDRDGTKDWTVMDGGGISEIMLPLDKDWDGDGVNNLLDSSPWDKKKGKLVQAGIPKHLRLSTPRNRQLQKELYREFKILAVDYTDLQSPSTLSELLKILRANRKYQFFPRPKEFKVLYSFAGHDAIHDLGAYHRSQQAISIGGITAYPSRLHSEAVALTLLHEMGHSLFFEKIVKGEIFELNRRWAYWDLKPGAEFLSSLMVPTYLRGAEAQKIPLSFVSGYSTTNFHEWFAESFAAFALVSLRKATGEFGPAPDALSDRRRWARYEKIPGDLYTWFKIKFQHD
jgi:hypothetical protein